jgi:hypothetical protein
MNDDDEGSISGNIKRLGDCEKLEHVEETCMYFIYYRTI